MLLDDEDDELTPRYREADPADPWWIEPLVVLTLVGILLGLAHLASSHG